MHGKFSPKETSKTAENGKKTQWASGKIKERLLSIDLKEILIFLWTLLQFLDLNMQCRIFWTTPSVLQDICLIE